jgi:hypothetical protein
MPLVGQDAIVQWLRSQLPYASGASLFADTSTAGDLGYTYGRYATPGAMPEHGFYVRIWTCGTDGVWRVAVDVLQPQ